MKRLLVTLLAVGGLVIVPTAAAVTNSEVTVGSPSGETPRNHQNEPAVAIDAANPNVVVAGTNDYIDQQPCPRTLPETAGELPPGIADERGRLGCVLLVRLRPLLGAAHVHGMDASGLRSDDPVRRSCGADRNAAVVLRVGTRLLRRPAVAVGPRPGPNGFAWANGSRVTTRT